MLAFFRQRVAKRIVKQSRWFMSGSRNFHQGGGGGGVQVSLTKKSSDVFFLFFLVLSLFYKSQIVNFRAIYHFSRLQRVSNIFQGGPTFSRGGGSNCLFPIETYITCVIFQGGPDPPPPPPPRLDPHLYISIVSASIDPPESNMYFISNWSIFRMRL